MTNTHVHGPTADAPARPPSPAPSPPDAARPDLVRTLLWLVLVISTVGNSVASFLDAGTGAHLLSGLVTTAGVAALVVRRVRTERRDANRGSRPGG
ncbi:MULTISPECIES: hypothetical protein [unclassified Streptomyces]|uniref:hypothetical protein n=1 Tax=unclassified Streptomyces TaxID=2593676 RepID=UPI002DD9F0AD|nr:hypothetical protein [Streptomyces sp. NBC_01775]WSB79037.1 hypothetical protein OHB04_27010 [Streptomyces sp. NBC_01775]WSS41546.1 hypothetical protein OG220_13755 [Streptomyces sp. NBC_01187]